LALRNHPALQGFRIKFQEFLTVLSITPPNQLRIRFQTHPKRCGTPTAEFDKQIVQPPLSHDNQRNFRCLPGNCKKMGNIIGAVIVVSEMGVDTSLCVRRNILQELPIPINFTVFLQTKSSAFSLIFSLIQTNDFTVPKYMLWSKRQLKMLCSYSREPSC